jgi:hypothetical protein
MAPILESTCKYIQRAPAFIAKQIERGAENLSSVSREVLDTVPKGVSKLNELAKRMEVSDELLKSWQTEAMSAASPGKLHAGYLDGPQAPAKS